MTGTRSSRAPDAWPLRFKRRRHPREGGCNPIGFNECGHDSAITFSRHPVGLQPTDLDPWGRPGPMLPQTPEFDRFLRPCPIGPPHAGCTMGPGLPTDLGPWAEGPRDGIICSERAMKANWITASNAGVQSLPLA